LLQQIIVTANLCLSKSMTSVPLQIYNKPVALWRSIEA